MKAIILAAGRGKRMRSLTDNTPKPLLKINGKPLIQYHIEALVSAGIHDIVINLAYLGKHIQKQIGDGSHYHACIQYSQEQGAGLETAGGIHYALPLLGQQPFLVVNADIYCNYPFKYLLAQPVKHAHLILVNNPEHHPKGDFHINKNTILSSEHSPKYTYSGIGLYHPDLFKSLAPGRSALGTLLRQSMKNRIITGELYQNDWFDIGTPERLNAINQQFND